MPKEYGHSENKYVHDGNVHPDQAGRDYEKNPITMSDRTRWLRESMEKGSQVEKEYNERMSK